MIIVEVGIANRYVFVIANDFIRMYTSSYHMIMTTESLNIRDNRIAIQ